MLFIATEPRAPLAGFPENLPAPSNATPLSGAGAYDTGGTLFLRMKTLLSAAQAACCQQWLPGTASKNQEHTTFTNYDCRRSWHTQPRMDSRGVTSLKRCLTPTSAHWHCQ